MIRTIHFEDNTVTTRNKLDVIIAKFKAKRAAEEARRNAPVIAPEILKAEYLLKQIQGQSYLYGRYGKHHAAILNAATTLVQVETGKLPVLTPEQTVEFENRYPVPNAIPEGKPLPAITGPVKMTPLGETGAGSFTKSSKQLATDADTVHSGYLADTLQFSDLMDAAYEFLEQKCAADPVEFLATIHDQLEDKSFGLGQKFSTSLLKAYKAHGANQGIQTSVVEQQEHLEAAGEEFEATEDVVANPITDPDSFTTRFGKTKNYESLVQEQLIDRLNGAYAAHKTDPSEATVKELFEAIGRFAMAKIKNQTWDASASGAATQEDAAQDVAMQVWISLDKFLGRSSQFHSWVSTMAHSAGQRLFNEYIADKNKFRSLFIQMEDGTVEDNPELYSEDKPEYQKELPSWIKGVDLKVCQGIRAGKPYRVIAEELGITETGVKQRCHRMKLRILAEKKAYMEVRKASKW